MKTLNELKQQESRYKVLKEETIRGKVLSVSDLDDSYQFVSDSQDIASIKSYIPSKYRNKFDSFFVLVGDGDYDEIWGMEGTVPNLTKSVYRLV